MVELGLLASFFGILGGFAPTIRPDRWVFFFRASWEDLSGQVPFSRILFGF